MSSPTPPYDAGTCKVEVIKSPHPQMPGRIVRLSWKNGFAWLDMPPDVALEVSDKMRERAREALSRTETERRPKKK